MAKVTIITDGKIEDTQESKTLGAVTSPAPQDIPSDSALSSTRDCLGPQVVEQQDNSIDSAIPVNRVSTLANAPTKDVTAPLSYPNPPAPPNGYLEGPVESLNEGRYDGDKLDLSGPLESNKSGTWETLPFESPFELMYFFTPHLQQGIMPYHTWQIEVTEELAKAKPTSEHPYRFALCAANGSGKDSYVVAPFVIWFALTRIRSLTIITSSSGVQLTAQTENYIASLARTVNTYFGEPIFKITKRFIKCLKSGSEIRMFATDEEGKAEGYHPFPDYPNAEMAIIVNEAKTVKPEIFRALSRCTGYNYWLNVSTPNEPIGDFYHSFTTWKHARRVTAFDCPHISRDHIDEVRKQFGEHSSVYRSQILALFTSIGGSVVIDQDHLNRCIEHSRKLVTKPKTFGKVKIGLDTAAGRDENAMTVIHGNIILVEYCLYFREKDTTLTEESLDRGLNRIYAKYGKDQCEIYADDGGVGHGILDHLVKRGHTINRVLNQSRAFVFKQYANRGTEMWYNIRRIIEECLLYLPLVIEGKVDSDPEMLLYNQLAYRHFKKNETSGRIALMSKSEEKAEGHKSPDRADALALALSSTHFEEIEKALADTDKREAGYTFEQLQQMKFNNYRDAIMGIGAKSEPIKGNSLEALLMAKGLV